MTIDFSEIDELRYDSEGQLDWWTQHGGGLNDEERGELFEFIVDQNQWLYLDLLIELSLTNLDDPDQFVADLERIEPYIDGDLAWGRLYDEFRQRIEDRDGLAKTIYEQLISRDDEWLTWMGGVALGNQREGSVREESLRLIRSDAENKVQAGIQAIIEQYQNQSVPEAHIEALVKIADRGNSTLTQEILRANAVLFIENDALWDLTVRIGQSGPGTIPAIARRFGPKIEETQLSEFLVLLEQGLEEGHSVDISRVSYFLHSRFADQSNLLADFVVCLSDYNLYESGRLAMEITKENPAFQSYLKERRPEFQNEFIANQILSETQEYVDEGISELARLLEAAFEEDDPQTKGALLEDAAEQLIDLVDAFEYARNVTATEEEIDVMVHNHFDSHIQNWGTPILIECRNRSNPVQAKHVRDFEGKLWNRTSNTGFIISRSGFTDGAEEQVVKSRSPRREKMIGMVNMQELYDITESGEIISLLQAKYDEVNEL